jgi:TatD DNase family protein
VNGCSLKSKENIKVIEKIPLDKMMIETDSPYCEIRNTHESM